jgi:DNA invertase Pin-like site-specific DNA recombinase
VQRLSHNSRDLRPAEWGSGVSSRSSNPETLGNQSFQKFLNRFGVKAVAQFGPRPVTPRNWPSAWLWQFAGDGVGPKSRDGRPEFDRLLRDAAQRQFDLVMAWSVDRLGRSLQDLVGFLSELHALRIDLFLHQQGLDTTTPGGKAMFQMMGVFAEFERAIIAERVRAGLRRAVSEGKTLGRPRLAADVEQRISAALKARTSTGDSVRKIAARFGVDASTVQRIAALSSAPPRDGAQGQVL